MKHNTFKTAGIAISICIIIFGCNRNTSSLKFSNQPSVQLVIPNNNISDGGIVSVNWSSQSFLTMQGMTRSDWPIYISGSEKGNPIAIEINNVKVSGYSPVISSDAKYLVYASYSTTTVDSKIYISTINQGQDDSFTLSDVKILLDNQNYASLAWSPNNRQLAILGVAGNGIGLYTYDIPGGTLQKLIEYHEESIRAPGIIVWSPNETQLAFSIEYDIFVDDKPRVQSDIFVYDIGGNRLIRLTSSAEVNDESPSWFPKDNILTYASTNLGDAKLIDSNLVFSTSDGKCVKTLTGLKGIASSSWSPDGTKIAFVSAEGIEIMDSLKTIPQKFLSVSYLCDKSN